MNYVQRSLITLTCMSLAAGALVSNSSQRGSAKESATQTNDSVMYERRFFRTPPLGLALQHRKNFAVQFTLSIWIGEIRLPYLMTGTPIRARPLQGH